MGVNQQYFTYLMSNERGNVLYTGVTNSLERRVWEHKNHTVAGFTKRYNCDQLVYFEMYDDVAAAIGREKQIKKWSRQKKHILISSMNPTWRDLAADWYNDHHQIPRETDQSPESGDPSTVLRPAERGSGGSG